MNKLALAAAYIAAALSIGVTLPACSEQQPPLPEAAQVPAAPVAPAAAPPSAPAPAPAPAPTAAAEQPSFTPEALESLLAPVALYPDPVLAQVLATSTNPQEVLDAGNWLLENPDLKGKELEAAGTALGFTPPMLALIQFPTVVDMMCMEMDWTTELGVAFQADEPAVLAAVQRLRKQAAEMGNLQSSEQMNVATEKQNDQQVIIVQPANPEVVYVPQYNPTAVYTTPAPATTTAVTTTSSSSGYTGGEMVATGLLAFGAGILVNEVFDDDDDDRYYPNYGYGGPAYYPPPYYPRYGNGYRPASGYNRPPNYQHGFNNNNIYVNTDGKNYFNRFEGDKNNYRRNSDSPIGTTGANRQEAGGLSQRAQATNRPAATGVADSRKVQGTYAGAKQGAAAQRPAVKSKVPAATYAGAGNAAARRPVNSQTAGARDRGRAADAVAKPAAQPQGVARKPTTRPTTATSRTSTKGPGAFQGSRNSGKSERAASQRGRNSMNKSGQKRGRNR
ncbi:MAG: DUF3300 domain-containing protein [Halioglobus sp.]|nr:DUF3300 domain-containing protein [Halioglobus sp.]